MSLLLKVVFPRNCFAPCKTCLEFAGALLVMISWRGLFGNDNLMLLEWVYQHSFVLWWKTSVPWPKLRSQNLALPTKDNSTGVEKIRKKYLHSIHIEIRHIRKSIIGKLSSSTERNVAAKLLLFCGRHDCEAVWVQSVRSAGLLIRSHPRLDVNCSDGCPAFRYPAIKDPLLACTRQRMVCSWRNGLAVYGMRTRAFRRTKRVPVV